MTRRNYLTMSGLALGGLMLGGAPGKAASASSTKVRPSLNENPFGPSPQALAAIRDLSGELCRYVDSDSDVLTPAITEYENVAADQIVLGEILPALGLHLAKSGPQGGEFIYSEPGYTALVNAVSPGGGVVIGVPLNGNLQNDLGAIANAMNGRTRAIYLVNPHNPSGTVGDKATFIAFVHDMAKRTLVIVDEAYLEFEPDFSERTVASLTRAGDNVVVFRTFGKIYGLAGLNVGYAIAPVQLAASLKQAGIGAPGGLTLPAIVAATASLRDQDYVTDVRSKVVAERDQWNKLLDRLHCRRANARGNFIFFETGRPHHDMREALLGKGVDIGRGFQPLDQWARISIGLPGQNAIARAAVTELLG